MESEPTLRRAQPTRVPGLGVLAVGLALAGCGLLDSPATTLLPRSDFGWTSHRIFVQILRWDTAIFLVVQVLLLVAVFRFRERDPRAVPRQVRGSAVLELIWTLIPAVILAFIAFPTVAAIFRTQAAPPKDALRVEVIGHQWWWEFRYPELGIVTANELHLPVGRPVRLEIDSRRRHPQLLGAAASAEARRDPRQGERASCSTADAPGEYYGQCAEFCGASHANMRIPRSSQTPADVRRPGRRSRRSRPPTPPDGSPARRASSSSATATCVGCHTIRGVSAGATRARTSRTSAAAPRSPPACCRTRRRTWRAWVRRRASRQARRR